MPSWTVYAGVSSEAMMPCVSTTMVDGAGAARRFHILRNILMKRGASKKQGILRDERKAPMIIRCWNLLRKDPRVRLKNVNRLVWRLHNSEEYPVIQ